jgi:hypothetical protein
MKTATVKELQSELEQIPQPDLVSLCLRLSRFKKENKELLTYLLFESFDEEAYVNNVKKYIDEEFAAINTSSLYFVKKSLRKILRTIAKYIRYTGSATAEAQLLIHFCATLVNSGIPFKDSQVLVNLYRNQLKKTANVIAGMHEDLQYDFRKELDKL